MAKGSLSDYLKKNYGIKKTKPKKERGLENSEKPENQPKASWREEAALLMKNDEKEQPKKEDIPLHQQTVYRDKSGRKVNIEEKLKQDRIEEERKQAEKKRLFEEHNVGEHQRLKKRRLEQDLENIKHLKTTVYADDEQLNKEMKAKVLEDDPLLSINSTLTGEKPKQSQPASKFGRKLYNKGVPPANRFNIVPGHRWDGVDRSNGYEMRWFNRQYSENRGDLETLDL